MMPNLSDKPSIIPSLLDRLLDDCPYLSSDGIPGTHLNPSVRAVAAKAIALSGLTVIDGVELKPGDRVLITNQAPNFLNGVYLVTHNDWVRVADSAVSEMRPGGYWIVSEGQEYSHTQWRLVNQQEIVLGTTPILIERFIAKLQFQSVRDLKASVARDLEALFNTHQEALSAIADDFPEVSHSLVTYGVPDITSFDVRNPQDRDRISNLLKEMIDDFEPRLKNINVELQQLGEHAQNLHFRLDALLEVHPVREPVSFDAVLKLDNKSYRIKDN